TYPLFAGGPAVYVILLDSPPPLAINCPGAAPPGPFLRFTFKAGKAGQFVVDGTKAVVVEWQADMSISSRGQSGTVTLDELDNGRSIARGRYDVIMDDQQHISGQFAASGC